MAVKKITFTKKDIERNKGMAVISYVSILCLIPFFFDKHSKFAQFHAKQGVVLFGLEVIFMVFFNPLIMLFFPVLILLYMPIAISFVILSLLGIVKAIKGEAWEMPVIFNLVKSFDS